MNAHLSDLSDRIGHLLTRRRDPRVLLGITVITIAALVAGAVMAFAMRPSPRPDGTLPQVAARSSATPSLHSATPTPFASSSVRSSIRPESSPAATPTPTPAPTQSDPQPRPTPVEASEPDPTPTPDPKVDLQVGDDPSGLPGIAGYRIEHGDSVVQILHLTTWDLDRSKCRVTQRYEPDHPDLPDRSISLPADAEQEVTLADGSHTFEARCPSIVGTVSASVRVIAMDGRPEACEGFEFVRDDITATSYEELRVGILDAWHGCVSTPWTPMYEVFITFNADGTYSAHTGEELDGVRMIALYYGTDDDSPLKKYAITDLQDSGLGIGEIDIFIFGKNTVRDSLRNVRLMGDKLEFEMFHQDRYGPLTFRLSRIVGP
jgi:hypothetical protein